MPPFLAHHRNIVSEFFDSITDFVNYLIVASKCEAVLMPYRIFLGLGSASSIYSTDFNLRQAYSLSINGIVTSADELSREVRVLAFNPEMKVEMKDNGGRTSTSVLSKIKTKLSRSFGKISGGAATVLPEGENGAEAVDSVPFFVQTYKLRVAAEVQLINSRLLKERIMCALFVILLEDFPMFLME